MFVFFFVKLLFVFFFFDFFKKGEKKEGNGQKLLFVVKMFCSFSKPIFIILIIVVVISKVLECKLCCQCRFCSCGFVKGMFWMRVENDYEQTDCIFETANHHDRFALVASPCCLLFLFQTIHIHLAKLLTTFDLVHKRCCVVFFNKTMLSYVFLEKRSV